MNHGRVLQTYETTIRRDDAGDGVRVHGRVGQES